MPDKAATRITPPPASGRVFTGERRVRVGDVSTAGRLRLDGLAAYAQDLAGDDLLDVGFRSGHAWVVRRTLIEVHEGARLGEVLEMRTWCSGIGSRWAERRVSVVGSKGARAEVALSWVALDLATQRAVPLPESFAEHFGEAAAGRVVSARLTHGATPAGSAGEAAERSRWSWRVTDLDVLGHVNNAAAWAVVEEHLADRPIVASPHRAEIEYRRPIDPGEQSELVVRAGPAALELWASGTGADLQFSASVRPLTPAGP